jgi:hypothetical protein
MKQLTIILAFLIGIGCATVSLAATHFECFDRNFNAITSNFYVDGTDVYWSEGNDFEPLKSFVTPGKYWVHLGNGRFKHKLTPKKIKQCKATNKKFSKPKPVSAKTAIRLCKRAISNDRNTVNPKMPKKKKYKLVTDGEFKLYERNKKYGYVVFEAERKGWFLNGLYLVICQVDLIERSAFVAGFESAKFGNESYQVGDWYKIKRTDLVKTRME